MAQCAGGNGLFRKQIKMFARENYLKHHSEPRKIEFLFFSSEIDCFLNISLTATSKPELAGSNSVELSSSDLQKRSHVKFCPD